MKLSENSIRKFAKGMTCQVQIPGYCTRDTEKTVMAHATILPPTGAISAKTDSDVLATYIACSNCHDIMDGRMVVRSGVTCFAYTKEDRLFFEYRAVMRTWRLILKEMEDASDKV